MLFQKSLLRELRSAFGGVFAVLITTLVTVVLIRTLGRAAAGRVDSDLVFPLIVFNALNFMSAALTLAIYVSIILVLSRWWRDSEAVVWLTAGKSLSAFYRPIWRFLWPLLLLVTVMSVFIAPWSQERIIAFEEELKQRGDASRVTPGQFRESYSGSTVFFVENPDAINGSIGTVFVRTLQGTGAQSVIVSSTGSLIRDTEAQNWMILERGYRVDFTPGLLESRLTKFDIYRIRIDNAVQVQKADLPIKAVPTAALVGRSDSVASGEKVLRFGLPLVAFGLGLLAVPMAVVSSRSARSLNLIFVLLIYLLSSNLLTSSALIVNQGRLSFEMAVWPVSAALVLAALGLTWWRSR
ncbi:MAG: LPS export ABC transporter permease LptF [Chitinophagia bacterium]|nr:LPS export ABC transporter permease LptF [Chitinophagia bacterium]